MKLLIILLALIIYANVGLAAEVSPATFPLHLTEHSNQTGTLFDSCAVEFQNVNGRTFIRTDLGSQNWHMYAGGLKDQGRQNGTVWRIQTVDGSGDRETTTITFDSDLQTVIRAQIEKTDASGSVISNYICIKPATA